MEKLDSEFDQILKKEWSFIYNDEKKKTFKNNLKDLKKRLIGKYTAIFNEKFIENKRDSNIEFEFEEEENSNEPMVFQNFDENKFNFNQIPQEQVLFYVNLEEEEIINKEQGLKHEEEEIFNKEALDYEITENTHHPLIINQSPICFNHSMICLFPKEELPQVIGSDLIILLLEIFKMSNSPNLRIGAFSSVNHIHFHIIYSDDLFEKEKAFPIEFANVKTVIKSSLECPDDQINMYTVGIKISELENYPVRGFVIEPIEKNFDYLEMYNSIGFVAGTITNILLDKVIPHNILFSEKGAKIYIIPRKFEKFQTGENDMKCAWIETSGVAICRNSKFFEELTDASFEKFLKENVSLSETDFDGIKKSVLEIMKKFNTV